MCVCGGGEEVDLYLAVQHERNYKLVPENCSLFVFSSHGKILQYKLSVNGQEGIVSTGSLIVICIFKIELLFYNSFVNTIRVSNSLDHASG